MSCLKLFRRLIERKRPVTIYLSRGAFEGGVMRLGAIPNVECVDVPAASETEERFIPSCQIVPGISLDGMDLVAVALH